MGVFDLNDTPVSSYHRKSGSFEKRTHATPNKNKHPEKRRNTNPEDAPVEHPSLNLGADPPAPPIFPSSAQKEEMKDGPPHRRDIQPKIDTQSKPAPPKEPDSSLNCILSHLEQQSKTLEQLNTRVGAIEESRSAHSSRSHSRASERGGNKLRAENVSVRALNQHSFIRGSNKNEKLVSRRRSKMTMHQLLPSSLPTPSTKESKRAECLALPCCTLLASCPAHKDVTPGWKSLGNSGLRSE